MICGTKIYPQGRSLWHKDDYLMMTWAPLLIQIIGCRSSLLIQMQVTIICPILLVKHDGHMVAKNRSKGMKERYGQKKGKKRNKICNKLAYNLRHAVVYNCSLIHSWYFTTHPRQRFHSGAARCHATERQKKTFLLGSKQFTLGDWCFYRILLQFSRVDLPHVLLCKSI